MKSVIKYFVIFFEGGEGIIYSQINIYWLLLLFYASDTESVTSIERRETTYGLRIDQSVAVNLRIHIMWPAENLCNY